MPKYYYGKTYYDSIILFRRKGESLIEDRIGPSQFQWYFCIQQSDVKKHKSLFVELIDEGLVYSVSGDENSSFARIYCTNLNIYDPSEENSDARWHVLKKMKECEIRTYEADLSSLDRYMVDRNIEIDDKHLKAYFDIETKDVEDDVVVGRDPILSVAIKDDQGDVHFYCHDNEEVVLRNTIKQLSKYTIIMSWYGKEFDFPYLRQRAKLHGIDFGNLYNTNHIDLLEWFKSSITSGAIKEKPKSMKLNDISEQYLGEVKTEGVKPGHGNIWNLFKNDRERLKEYNIQDVNLLYLLDKKLQASEQIIATARVCGVFPGRASNTQLTDKFLLRLARKKETRLPSIDRNAIREKIPESPGGRVFIKKPGVYDFVMGFDFVGYYNSIMRYFNIGPDTKVSLAELEKIPLEKRSSIKLIKPAFTYVSEWFIKILARRARTGHVNCQLKHRIIEGYEGLIVPYVVFKNESTRTVKELLKEVFEEIVAKFTIKETQFLFYFFKIKERGDGIISVFPPFSTYFRADFPSIAVEALNTYVSSRNHWKEKRKELLEAGKEDSFEFKQSEIMINVFKLLGNVIYGQAGAAHSRIYDPVIPPSITMTAQFSTNLVKSWFEKRGASVVYMDTDSNYIVLENREKYEDLVSDFNDNFHNYLYKNLEKYFRIPRSNERTIKLEYEKRWSRMILYKKKKYAGKLEWEVSKGNLIKTDIKGLEFVRRGTIEYSKLVQKKLIDLILDSEKIPTSLQIFNWVKKLKDRFFSTEFTKKNIGLITKRVTVGKKVENYKSNTIYVRILKRMNERGDIFSTGSVLGYVTLKTNAKNKEGEEIDFFLKNNKTLGLDIDYEDYWNTEIYRPIRRLLEMIYPDQEWVGFDTVDSLRVMKRKKELLKRIETKVKRAERIKTVDMIVSYRKFAYTQKLELLTGYLHEADDKELKEKINRNLILLNNNFLDSEDDD